MTATTTKPTRSWSDKLADIEKKFVGVAMAVMGLVVFLDVAHRVSSTRGGLSQRVFGESDAGVVVGGVVVFAIWVGTVRGALAMRARSVAGVAAAGGVTAWLKAVAIVVAGFVALKVFVVVLPNGLVWSKTLGLVLMLWTGLIGASLATHERRHLALDLGSKLWPAKWLPIIQGVGNVVTAVFCAILAVLAVISIKAHFGDWQDTDGAGGIYPDLPVPKWIAFLVMPLGFGLMAARFVAQAIESFGGKVEQDDAMHMIGMDTATTENSTSTEVSQ